MKHLIITRLKYREKDLLKIRLDLLTKILIPCLKNQTNKNFELCIMMYDEDVELAKSIIDYNFITFEDYTILKKYTIDNNINIQTRHDSDDFMSEYYIDKIQSEYNLFINSNDIFLLQFQPEKINFFTNEIYPIPLYTNTCISGFVTLCQKNVKYIVYERSHITMHEITPNIYTYPKGYVKYYIHNNNDSSIPREERIKKWIFNNE